MKKTIVSGIVCLAIAGSALAQDGSEIVDCELKWLENPDTSVSYYTGYYYNGIPSEVLIIERFDDWELVSMGFCMQQGDYVRCQSQDPRTGQGVEIVPLSNSSSNTPYGGAFASRLSRNDEATIFDFDLENCVWR